MSVNKRAQVTIFVIIGVILILVTGFLFLNGKYEFWQSHDTKIKNQISGIIEDCVYDSANRGVFLLGYQGGYINVPPQIDANPFAYTDFGMKIPNWDSQRGDIPTINSMQIELNEFVEIESISCIENNLRALEEAFDISTEDDFSAQTRINDQSVVTEIFYTVNFNEKNSEEKYTLQDYTVSLEDVRLGDLYSLAVEIYNLEKVGYIFEDMVLDQIRTADDYSSKESMPTEGMAISCAEKIWTIPQLQDNLAQLNNNNFRYLQFEGTRSKEDVFALTFNDEIMPEEERVYYDNFYSFPILNPKRSFENYDVDVFVPLIETNDRSGFSRFTAYREFEVTPSEGQIVKSMLMEVDAGIKIPIPCIQVFHHLYKLDYDLIIKLTDYTEDDSGFFFQFPLRVQIDRNEPKDTAPTVLTAEPKTLNRLSYCSEESALYPMMVVVSDNMGHVLDDVNVSYKCMNLECEIGQTEKPTFQGVVRQYAEPELIADFPFCFGGKVIARKEGYHDAEVRVNTDSSLLNRQAFVGDNLAEIEMIPLKDFEASAETFLIRHIEDGTGKRVLSEADGSIYLNLESQSKDFESVVLWPTEQGFMDTLSFLDDEDVMYNLSIYYMDSNEGLSGMFMIQNWSPDIHSGNSIQFVIPGAKTEIKEDDYVQFYEFVQSVEEDPDYIPRFY